MTSIGPPNFNCTLSLSMHEYKVLSGKNWAIDVYLPEQKRPFDGSLVIPEGLNDVEAIRLLAWLWVDAPLPSLSINSEFPISITEEILSMNDTQLILPDSIKRKKYSVTICELAPY